MRTRPVWHLETQERGKEVLDLRRNKNRRLLYLLLLVLFSATQQAQADHQATVLVVDFQLSETVRPAMVEVIRTRVLTQKLKTALAAARRFEVVEREEVGTLLDEIDLSNSRLADRSQSLRAGAMLGADYVVSGEISLAEAWTSSQPIPGTDHFNVVTRGQLGCDVRVIDTERAVVVMAAPVLVSKGRKDLELERNDGPAGESFVDDLLRAMAQQIAVTITETVFPIKVAARSEGELFLNRGVGSELAVGDRLVVLSLGDQIVDPETGDSLGNREDPVAEIEVVQVLPKMSRALIRRQYGPLDGTLIVRHLTSRNPSS